MIVCYASMKIGTLHCVRKLWVDLTFEKTYPTTGPPRIFLGNFPSRSCAREIMGAIRKKLRVKQANLLTQSTYRADVVVK
jgi:hypothetical protein